MKSIDDREVNCYFDPEIEDLVITLYKKCVRVGRHHQSQHEDVQY